MVLCILDGHERLLNNECRIVAKGSALVIALGDQCFVDAKRNCDRHTLGFTKSILRNRVCHSCVIALLRHFGGADASILPCQAFCINPCSPIPILPQRSGIKNALMHNSDAVDLPRDAVMCCNRRYIPSFPRQGSACSARFIRDSFPRAST